MTKDNRKKNITQESVARHAGVSRSIVSYVINDGPRHVSEETRNRVLLAIKELGYRPNKYAQMLSSADNTVAQKYIGIILAGNYMFKRPYYGSILASIHEHVHEKGWHIRFIRVFEDFNNPDLFDELIHPNEISGAILIGLDQVAKLSDHEALMEAIIERVERVVCVEWEWPGIPSIRFDRQKAAYQATKHLLDLEHTQIAYIGPVDERTIGYQQALWEKQITPENELVYHTVDSQGGYDYCEHLLLHCPEISAICSGSDEVAVGILKCLHEHRLIVPNDMAVASIDNLDLGRFTIPALTSVDVSKEQLGLHAVDLVVSSYPWSASSDFVVNVPTQLVIRESSIVI